MSIKIEKDFVTVQIEHGKPSVDGEGKPTKDEQISRWNMTREQHEKHMRGIESEEHPWNHPSISKGDKDALRDAAQEFQKQRKS